MPGYTTGEVAKICQVTVRTIQYYDTENILHPSEVSEGGRRLYSESDVARLKEICTMKSLGVSLAVIKEVMRADNGHEILSTFLEEEERIVSKQIDELEDRRKKMQMVRQNITDGNWAPIRSKSGIDKMMVNRKKRKNVMTVVLAIGVLADILEIFGIAWWIMTGSPYILLGALPFIIVILMFLITIGNNSFYKYSANICPSCHVKFKPNKKEWFMAYHTPKLRKVTCTSCGYKGLCIDTYADEED